MRFSRFGSQKWSARHGELDEIPSNKESATAPSRLELMKPLKLKSISEQVADHLRQEIEQDGLVGELPGARTLAEKLETNHKTVDAAVAMLQEEGILESQGPGKRRRIVRPNGAPSHTKRVAILVYEPDDFRHHIVVHIQHGLAREGHKCVPVSKSLAEMKMDLNKVKRVVEKTQANAWIVVAANKEVLSWFAEQDFPTFALHGMQRSLPIAGASVDKVSAMLDLVRSLASLGHERIVLLVREEHLKPTLRPAMQRFLDTLEEFSIKTGPYNLPHWSSDPESLHQCLEQLFKLTPPTALLVDESSIFLSVQEHLARRGIVAPRDLSLVSLAPDPAFQWFRPLVSHIDYDGEFWVRTCMDWIGNVARGKEDKRQKLTQAKLIEGGTIGPVKGSK